MVACYGNANAKRRQAEELGACKRRRPDNGGAVGLVMYMQVRQIHRAIFEEVLRTHIATTRLDEGCLRVEALIDKDNQYIVYESFRTEEALLRQTRQPHFLNLKMIVRVQELGWTTRRLGRGLAINV